MSSLLSIFSYSFAHPIFFWLLFLVPFMIFWHYYKQKKSNPSLILSSLDGLEKSTNQGKARFVPMLFWLRVMSVIFIILALARPQSSNVNERINSEGIDIAISIDISGSMLAEDFKPNRIGASKKVVKDFISERLTDRIALVIFAGESFTQCPLTTDKNILLKQLENIRSGLLEDGTAIGMGLATAVDRLRTSQAKSKVIILLTDGVNNSGLIDPMTALEIAKSYQTRVYTIGVGSKGTAPYPVQMSNGQMTMQNMPVQIDEQLLQKISKETGGKYFRATNNNTLSDIYKEIDKLERSKVEINSFKKYSEHFHVFAFLGLLFLFMEIMLRYTWLRSFP